MARLSNKIGNKVGFEVEYGKFYINRKDGKKITNGEILFAIDKSANVNPKQAFLRIETEGTKSLSDKQAYFEIISGPLADEDEIKYFFNFVRKIKSMTFKGELKDKLDKLETEGTYQILPQSAAEEYKFASRTSTTINPMIHINLGIRLEDVYESEKLAGIMYAEAREKLQQARAYADSLCERGASVKLKAFLTLVMYQLIVYVKNEVKDNYKVIDVNLAPDMREEVYKIDESKQELIEKEKLKPGSEYSYVKYKFPTLFKVAQADIIRLALNREIPELKRILGLDGAGEERKNKLIEKIQAIILKEKLTYEKNAAKRRAARLLESIEKNIAAFENNTGKYEYNEPRYSGLIEPYNPGDGCFYIVAELRKSDIPLVDSVKKYIDNAANTYWIKELKDFFK